MILIFSGCLSIFNLLCQLLKFNNWTLVIYYASFWQLVCYQWICLGGFILSICCSFGLNVLQPINNIKTFCCIHLDIFITGLKLFKDFFSTMFVKSFLCFVSRLYEWLCLFGVFVEDWLRLKLFSIYLKDFTATQLAKIECQMTKILSYWNMVSYRILCVKHSPQNLINDFALELGVSSPMLVAILYLLKALLSHLKKPMYRVFAQIVSYTVQRACECTEIDIKLFIQCLCEVFVKYLN